MPSSTGMRMSIITTSGSSAAASASVSAPSAASPMTCMSGWDSRMVRSPARTPACVEASAEDRDPLTQSGQPEPAAGSGAGRLAVVADLYQQLVGLVGDGDGDLGARSMLERVG